MRRTTEVTGSTIIVAENRLPSQPVPTALNQAGADDSTFLLLMDGR